MTDASDSAADALVAWLRAQPDYELEDGLAEAEIHDVEERFDIVVPPLWRRVLARVHPIGRSKPPRGPHGTLPLIAYPDWRLRDEATTRNLIDAPIDGLLFDVEHNDFWWADWGQRLDEVPARRKRAVGHLADVPRLVPLWSHLYVAATDDSPVFSIVQADLYVPALSVADLPTGQNQGVVALDDWPIGNIPFWSDLHAYSQLGPQGPFAYLGTGGL